MKKASILLVCILVACMIMLAFGIQSFAAGAKYISEIKLEAGKDAKTKLEDAGYNVFLYGLNLDCNGANQDDKLLLGCKYTADADSAIRDLVVSSSKDSSIKFNDRAYSLVSDLSINKGVNGSTLYLYQTKDKAAGDPIVDLSASIHISGSGNPEFLGKAIFGDGSRTVLTTNKDPADFEAGVGTGEMYIGMVTSPMVKQYVTNIHIVKAEESKALKTLAGYYCTRYTMLSDGIYVGYSNTNNIKEAVRNIILYESTEKKVATLNGEYYKVDDVTLDNKYSLYASTSECEGSPMFGMFYFPKENGEDNIIKGKRYKDWVDILYKSKNSDSLSLLLDDSGYLDLKKNNNELLTIKLKKYSLEEKVKEYDLMLIKDPNDNNITPEFIENVKLDVEGGAAIIEATDPNALTDEKIKEMEENPDMEVGLEDETQSKDVASIFGYTDYALMIGGFIIALALGYFLVEKFDIKKIKKYL
ncbi:MAG: hypothetical protein MJ168_11975 [Clostridia bacterium]|nr:hypothetical protein [Clostridia bacterium]